MENRTIALIITFFLLLFAGFGLLIMMIFHYEAKIPYSWKLYGYSLVILPVMIIITWVLGYFGLYLPRFGPPPDPNNILSRRNT